MYNTKTYKRYKKFELWGGQNRANSINYVYLLIDNHNNALIPESQAIIAIENNKTRKVKFLEIDDIKKNIPRITDDILKVFFDIINNNQ